MDNYITGATIKNLREKKGITQNELAEQIVSNGNEAYLRTFTTGGHEPQLVGDYIENPRGNTLFNKTELKITPVVEELFNWIKKFD